VRRIRQPQPGRGRIELAGRTRLAAALDTLWHRPEDIPRRYFDLTALAIAVLAGAITLSVMTRYTHPSGGDAGQWLSMAHLYLGTGRADFSPYQYPPMLFLLLSALILLTGDPISALFATDFVLFAGIVLGCYCGYAAATGDRRGGLLFAALSAISQPMFEMVSWGGYPNLFSFAFFVPACAYLVVISRPAARRRDLAVFGLLAGLTLLSHPLSSLLLALCGATFVLAGWRGGLGLRWVGRAASIAAPIAAALYLPYLYLFLTMPSAGPTYVTGEETYVIGTALNPVMPPIIRGIFPWGLPATVTVLTALSALSLLALWRVGPTRPLPRWLAWLLPGDDMRARANTFLFVGAMVPPLLIPIAMWYLQLYTDYSRLLYFIVFPLAAGAAAVASRLMTYGGAAAFLGWLSRRRLLARALPRLRPQARRLPSAEAVVALLTVACVVSACTAQARFLERSTQYYIHFDDPQDLELANWVDSSTDIDDLLLLSPERINGWAIKWLGGLTGRETLGYFEPSSLFYQSERVQSYEVYHFFNYRYAIFNGQTEVGTQGAVGGDHVPARIAVINVYNGFPVLEFHSNQTWLVMGNDSQVNAGNFSEHSVVADFADREDPHLFFTARENATRVELVGDVTLNEDRAEVRFSVNSTGPVIQALNMTVAVPTGLCGSELGPGYAVLQVRTGGVCTPARLIVGGTTAPALRNGTLSFRVEFGGSTEATIHLANFGGPSGLAPGLDTFDGAQFLANRSVDYIVMLKESPGYVDFIQQAYHFPIAYQNSKYIVYRVIVPP
jgi:hypothetical protein